MAEQIVPNVFNIASRTETETGRLKSCIELINQTLQFGYKEAEQVARAQGQLFPLTEILGDIQERFASIQTDTYALAQVEDHAA